MDHLALVLIASVCCLGLLSYTSTLRKNAKQRQPQHENPSSTSSSNIPTIGYEGTFTSYLSAFRFARSGNIVLEEGCRMYKNRAFRVPLMDRWLVVVTGDHLFEKLRSAPENVLSAWEAMKELLQLDYTLGPLALSNPYHIDIMRTTLTKNLRDLLPCIVDETTHAFETEIGCKLQHGEWTSIPAEETFTQITCQVSNRAFVGLPVCRNVDYCKLAIQFTRNVMMGAAMINLFPQILRPLAGALFNKLAGHQRRMLQYLGPEIESRRSKYNEFGLDYPDKPNDMLTWVMESATTEIERRVDSLALRMLNVNFMAIHSTHLAFTHAVYNLASQPQYLEILREDISIHLDSSAEPDQWTVEAIDRCIKLDSFLKETLRLNGLGAISLPRKVLVPYKLPDGTVVPKGTIITAASRAAHLDSAHYERPEEFDGLRFAKLREKTKAAAEAGCTVESEAKYRLTSPGPGFLAFGSGRHICPGRFFGSLEIKCLLIHLVLNFDVKMENEGVRPPDEWMGPTSIPCRHAKVLFRRRKTDLA